jgi:hypothetical protein
MTAINTARKNGTRRELAAFIPATTIIKLARIRIAGTLALAVRFTALSIGTSLRLSHLFEVGFCPLKSQSAALQAPSKQATTFSSE